MPTVKHDLEIKFGSTYGLEEANALMECLKNNAPSCDKKVLEFMSEFFPISSDLPDVQRKNNLRLLEDMKRRYWDAPDLSNVGKNGYRFVNAISDFATHADPIRKTKNYNENLFLRTVEGNPMIDKAYKLALAAA